MLWVQLATHLMKELQLHPKAAVWIYDRPRFPDGFDCLVRGESLLCHQVGTQHLQERIEVQLTLEYKWNMKWN